MDRADPLQKPLLRFGSQWLQWSPRVFSESAPTLTTCPITFRGRAIPAGYSERDFGGIGKVRFARRPLTDLRWFLGVVSAGEPRQHGMADSLYERTLSTRRVHRLAAILLRRWQAEEIAKPPFPCVSRMWTEYMRSK